MSLLGGKPSDDDGDLVLGPVSPPHPSLASLDAFENASLRDLATGVLLAGVGPQLDANGAASQDDIEVAVKDAVSAAAGLTQHHGQEFSDRGLRRVVDEGIQVLEHSCLVRLWTQGSNPALIITRRGRAALDSTDPQQFIVVPGEQ
jgi:hypothetical protein